ncbi:MAG: PfkB family carbohydrate kinase [Fuerstiella sp.]
MKILGIGTTVVDRVVVMDAYPDADTKKEISDGWIQVGGPVPVALSTATSLGTDVRLLSRWGNDGDGRFITDTLSARRIDLGDSKNADAWQTGSAQVWLSQKDGSRTIAFSRGTFPKLTASDVTDEFIQDCGILHLDGWASDAAIAAAIKMRQQGGTVVLDAGSVKPGIDQLLPHVDVLIASKLFRDALQSAAASHQTTQQLLVKLFESHHHKSTTHDPAGLKPIDEETWKQLNGLTVIMTQGENGATLYNQDGVFRVEGHSVKCVDSNGAGDIFSGGVLHGIAQRWPFMQTLEFANRIAAESCTRFGNSASSY